MILITILVQNYFYTRNDPDKLKDAFIDVLRKKESVLRLNLAKLQASYHSLPDSVKIRFAEEYQRLYQNEKITFLVFKDDSLVFWSANSIPDARLLSDSNPLRPDIVQLRNGWYKVFRTHDSLGTYAGLILLQHTYPFQNDYLDNGFPPGFSLPAGTNLVLKTQENGPGSYKTSDDLLFLQLPSKTSLPGPSVIILFALYFSAFLFLLSSLYFAYRQIKYISDRKWILLPGFTFDVIFIRFLLFYFRIPGSLYESPLFGPYYFSSSNFLPSLGDFFINSILFLVISYVFFLHYPVSPKQAGKPFFKRAVNAALLLLAAAGGIFLCMAVIRELVLNSNIPLTFQDISSLNIYSALGFSIIAAFVTAFLLFFFKLSGTFSPRNFGVAFILMAVFSTFFLNHYNVQTEKEKRKLLAVRLSVEGDPMVEMLYSRIDGELISDPVIRGINASRAFQSDIQKDDSIVSFILKKYFNESWDNYVVQITICRPGKTLRIQPQNYIVNCDRFFQDIIADLGKPVSGNHLYYLDYGYGSKNYLAVVPLSDSAYSPSGKATAYIEINSKLLFKDLGYPELLIDKNLSSIPDITGYSYAFFRDGKLINRVGKVQYSLDLDHAVVHSKETAHFYTLHGIDNYCYPIGRNNYLIISKKADTLLDFIAPFSYFFLSFLVFSLVFLLTVRFSSLAKNAHLKLSERLEISMTGVLILSLLVVGFLFVSYIMLLNHNKNQENLSDRTHSILIEMQHKFGLADDLSGNWNNLLNETMTKFSNVFFSDINLYDPEGRLIGTSRPEIFEKGLVSSLINNIAYSNLKYAHSTLFIHDESIGTLQYSSAYIPFYNNRNVLLGYLNLPYFARQDDLKREISSFLMAFINIYVFLIIIGFFVALLVSNYITRPLRLLTLRLGKVTFGKSNEKLEWKRKDEVGQLVEEYNRKIDELAKSAEMLASSERESAWREMARQIAHEIKNPLTPMRLSVQYLQKSWKEKPEDWEKRIDIFTSTLIEQIDSLSLIASEFSDFARMPDPEKEILEFSEIIENTVVLYKNISNIRIINESGASAAYIQADRKQMMRVFTNLFNNSIDAIGKEKDGLIRVNLTTRENKHVITVADNGSGISPEQAGKIFQPNFTTKSGGMGLGLAIVKNIIIGSGGEITFASDPGRGTVFTISFPDAKPF